jgi:hypothetical protein
MVPWWQRDSATPRATPTVVDMRLTDFWSRMDERFGASYARSVAADHRLPALGATVDEAIAAGVETRDIWRAVCEEFEVPAHLR